MAKGIKACKKPKKEKPKTAPTDRKSHGSS